MCRLVLDCLGHFNLTDEASLIPTHNYLNECFVGEGLALPDKILKTKHLKIFLMNLELRILKLNHWRTENEFTY